MKANGVQGTRRPWAFGTHSDVWPRKGKGFLKFFSNPASHVFLPPFLQLQLWLAGYYKLVRTPTIQRKLLPWFPCCLSLSFVTETQLHQDREKIVFGLEK